MMTLDEALHQACAAVGITPPKLRRMRQWIRTDAIGKNGKGDGSVILDEDRATAFNWQTGEKNTVWLSQDFTPADKKRFAERRARDDREERERAARAGRIAEQLIAAAVTDTHPYLARKGFPAERALVVAADQVRRIGGDYLVPGAFDRAVLVPARIGQRVTSVQLIWPDGSKKFLYGGDMGGAFHRIATGTDTWLCEGFATGLSLRAALKGLNRRDTVLVCFSASNIAKVAQTVKGRCYIAADHDKPLEQFGGLGTGEHFARRAERPYAMPPEVGTDFNDLHQSAGIFAVQRILSDLIRGVAMS